MSFIHMDFGYSFTRLDSLVWTRVDTDPLNFTALLVNQVLVVSPLPCPSFSFFTQQISGFSPQILAALVDGTLGKVNLNPPSGGWTVGSGFRVNLVKDANDLSTIYAQSLQFNITQGSASASSGVSASASSPASKRCVYFPHSLQVYRASNFFAF